MSDSSRFIVEDLFTRNRLHLIFGPPRSGCSTLLHQIMWDWSQGEDILGHVSHPLPFGLIDAIRPLSEIQAQLEDLEIPLASIPHLSLMETAHEDRTIESVFRYVRQFKPPTPRVIFLDGLQALFQGTVIHYKDVLKFTIEVSRLCHRDQITVIGTIGTSKSQEGSDTPILQRVMGSTAWLATAGTLLHIAPTYGKELQPARVVTCFVPRRAPTQSAYAFTPSGKLEYRGDATLHPEMDAWLQQIAPGSDLTTTAILDAGVERHLSASTVQRWLQDQLLLGFLTLVERGTRGKPGIYRKPPSTSPN